MKKSDAQNQKHPARAFFYDLLTKKPLGFVGLVILVLFVLLAVFADFAAPYPMVNGSMQVSVMDAFSTSSPQHLLGCDSIGRDVLSYLIYGARTSVILCVCCACISMIISIIIGTLCAMLGGWFDLLVQRLVDAWLSIPGMLILLMLMSILGSGMPQLIFAMSVPSGIAGSRLIRSAALSIKNSEYIRTSAVLGSNLAWQIVKHIIPNILPLVITSMATSLSGVVLMESSLSLLGFGVNPATPSWGYMITNQGKTYMYQAPWLALYPGLCIGIMVFAANMFGDSIRDLMDPRLKGGVGTYNSEKIAKLARKKMEQLIHCDLLGAMDIDMKA